jgi:hypothetical protein
VEDGAYMHFIVFMEGNELQVLRTRKGRWRRYLFLFFRILYLWTIAYVSPLSIRYSGFLTLFASSS